MVLADEGKKQKYTAILLPIKTVVVQGDSRSYSYAVGISSVPDPHPHHVGHHQAVRPPCPSGPYQCWEEWLCESNASSLDTYTF